VSGCCLNYQKTVQCSYSSEIGLRLTGTWTFEITWIKICLDVGLASQQANTLATSKSGPNTLWFFLVGIYQRQSFVPPLPVSVNDLMDRITAVASADEDMLRWVWNEVDCRIDICRVTKGSHIERLQLSHTDLRTYTERPRKYVYFASINSTLVAIKRWKCLLLL
jgi:hypothetical protein